MKYLKKINPQIQALFVFWLVLPGAHAQVFSDQRQGFEVLIGEVTTLEQLIDVIEKSPPMPGRYRIDYEQLKRDLRILKAGIQDVTENPLSLERRAEQLQQLSGDYLQ